MKRLIIAGIHTEVGKTVVAAILTEALNGYYWKPVQCGFPQDRVWVNERLSQKNRCYRERYCLATPASPHLAARAEGVRIEAKALIPPICNAPLVIEGTGGILSPLNESENWIDAGIHWDASWVLVHRHYLGSLNHCFLTVEAMRARKLPILGVVFNAEGDLETENMLLKKVGAQCLGRLPWQKELTAETVQTIANQWRPLIQNVL